MFSKNVNNSPKTSLNLETLQLRHSSKAKDLGLKNPLSFINKNVKGSYAAKKMFAGASKRPVQPINSALVKRYLASIVR
ncbi:MAG: hypothetical protein K1000chlam1_00696 [Candidatus Anoxychlamydiales bacterium]|nr:hypothetical protein [Candidatus Anoxychlamydiales bacterium]